MPLLTPSREHLLGPQWLRAIASRGGQELTRSPLRGQRRNPAFRPSPASRSPESANPGSPDERPTVGTASEAVKAALKSPASELESASRYRHSSPVSAAENNVQSPANETSPSHLAVALDAAKRAADISRHYYAGNFDVETKADKTPVTQADVECEKAIRETILERFPDHGFYGEETGQTRADADYIWLVDPIDGTKGFVREYPFFSTQIALMHNGEVVLGVSSGTMMDELAWAEKGGGAFLNGNRIGVSNIEDPDAAAVSTGNLKSLARGNGWSALGEIVARADRIRGYGDFYHYHLLASGKIEAVIESDVNILDIAALSIIVREAGGVFTDLNGQDINLQTRSVLAANPALHAAYLETLSGLVD